MLSLIIKNRGSVRKWNSIVWKKDGLNVKWTWWEGHS